MLRLPHALLCGLLLLLGSARAAPPGGISGASRATGGRRLTGRFLHITDFHPDPFYRTYSSTAQDAACHRDHGPAGVYGAETSACDSPYALINQTFAWIDAHIKDDIDFVIWTGDSARHDNDEALPRTQKQVIRQNEYMVSKFADVFGHKNDKHAHTNDFVIPIVPTFGNNDIMPHNIFLGGPNRWTLKYLDIWRGFIPEAQRHQFQQGGWFSVEVIPAKLAVISLNTIYFFSSNSGVDGCADKREPGYEHMEWLRIQLQILRDRGMKAILMGHVPPARVDGKESWDETCWQKYTLWARQYRDVIVGSLYGHMNIDHFMLQDFDQIGKDAEKGRMASGLSVPSKLNDKFSLYEDGEVTVASASDYLINLRQAWAELPSPPTKPSKKFSPWTWLTSRFSRDRNTSPGKSAKRDYLDKIGGEFAERYAVTLVAPSVVPNYFPTLRIIEYNITGLENLSTSTSDGSWLAYEAPNEQLPIANTDFDDDERYSRDVDAILAQRKKRKGKKGKKKGPKKYKFKVPEGPSKSSPPGPAYSPQTLSWTRYVQYFANLTHINNDFVEPSPNQIEPTSANNLSPRTIFGLTLNSAGEIETSKWKEGKHGKHQGKRPKDEPHPKEFVYEVEYDTNKDKGFKDLTVRRWVEYARKIGQAGAKAAGVEEKDHFEDDDDDDDDDEAIMSDEEGEADAQDTESDESTIDDNQDTVRTAGKPHKKHKHKKGKHRKHQTSKEWFTFVKRAFVGTMDPSDIEELFGARPSMRGRGEEEEDDEEEVQEEEEEVQELIEL
ncbi:Endopolyphosphatase [Coniothyrium glycines]